MTQISSNDKGLSKKNKKVIAQKLFDGSLTTGSISNITGFVPISSGRASDNHKQPTIVDRKGNEQTLSASQKNAIFKKAKERTEKIKEHLCTREECDYVTEPNVQKMIKEIKLAPQIEAHRNGLKAIGADPEEYDYESMRQRGSPHVKNFGGVDFDENGEIKYG